ncbi:hypothetical protein PR048_007581 [Dryococelus australis]|uniref:HTH CENPB-type domain-containing protein n=1 Tax=Dryococelus australis TaxID=614101 RepID=A0ABQ9HUN4_9NEOP|nr:hypothetical protein PR048_007581 [Dryococelus australis]
MSSELEVELVSYIVKMQELGFGLTGNQIRHLACKSAEQSGSQHQFNNTKEMAGWFWWVNFKGRHGLTLRKPENLALYRASTANREILNDFYAKLENLAESLQMTHLPGQFRNIDETGLAYVMKPNKVVKVVAVTDEAIAPSLVTERPQAHQQSTNNGNTTYMPICQLPQTNQERVTPKRDPKAKMISPTLQAGPSSSPDATSYNPTPDATISHQKVLPLKQINIKKGKYKEDWFCGCCGRSYNEDVVEKMPLDGFSVVFGVFAITVHAKMLLVT